AKGPIKAIFFMFLDSETEKVSVVYRRKDGQYGLIRSEN
ncbi:MAG: sigma 54 modulation/S30EA ribosomal C-terminal domain-containing protein, partial [Clostridia bacterium]|nr:sigma 54 modulation/S30EA ribosomal C-terminal domain-containing protein [Clostridia bacterium]